METYKKYKDSGIEWLGKIPAHWEVQRIKNLFFEVNERSMNGNQELLSVSQYTGVTKKTDRLNEGDKLTNAATLEGYKIVKKKQLVSNIMLAWNGSLGFSEYNGITSPAYCIYSLKRNDYYKYFHYLFKTDLYKSEFKRNSSGVIESRLRLYTDDFFDIYSLLPPIREQEAIAAFLDEKCGKIDEAIRIKQEQIEKLKEFRQVIIHKAVTKGLDKNAPMKNSGIEWIGKVPKYWEIMRLKFLLCSKLKYGANESGVEYDKDLPRYIRISDFGSNGKLNDTKKLSLPTIIANDYLLNDGDILFARSGATVGKAYQFKLSISVENKYCFAGYLIKATPDFKLIMSDFLYYYTQSAAFFYWKESIFNKATIENISADKYSELRIPLPSLSEQQQIVSYLDSETSKMDEVISLKTEQIERLKEYKQSLINEAVTGKIKVSN